MHYLLTIDHVITAISKDTTSEYHEVHYVLSMEVLSSYAASITLVSVSGTKFDDI